MMPVGGSTQPRFAGVRRVFEELGGPGSALAVVRGGDVVAEHAMTYGWPEVPAVNLHTTALSLARFYATLAGEPGVVQASGHDRLLRRHVDWGLGVQVEETGEFRGPSAGAGKRSLGDFGRSERLIEALEECL